MSRNDARHRRLFLRRMAELQKRSPCSIDHATEPCADSDPMPDPDTNGHRIGSRKSDPEGYAGCYPESVLLAVLKEITEP